MKQNKADSKENLVTNEQLIAFASELEKMKLLFHKLISKLDLNEQKSYDSQFSYFLKKANEILKELGISVISPEIGLTFDMGLPVAALNITDFKPSDFLVIDRVVEPIVMQNGSVVKTGTILLRRGQK